MLQKPPIILTNGQFDSGLSVLDRGLAYGDGLFETCRVRAGEIPLWEKHRQRLEKGARHFGIPLDVVRLETERARILSKAREKEDQGTPGDGVLKLIVTRGEGGQAYAPPTDPVPSYCWQLRCGTSPSWEKGQDGVVLFECQHRLGDNPALAGHKHLNRLEYVLARSEWRDEYLEGLLCDVRDCAIEGTLSNIFVRTKMGWCTPLLKRNGVAGVMRDLILSAVAPSCNVTITPCDLPIADVKSARELFVCNSVFGIWPVSGLSGGQRFEVGEDTRQLQSALRELIET